MRFFCLLLLLLSHICLADYKAQVIKVIDGDTIEVKYHSKSIRIRLYAIDAPERGQAYGQKARRYLADLIAGKIVQVENRGTDIYHRQLAYIYYHNKSINELMVANGFAWAYTYQGRATNPDYQTLQARAKRARLGLWADKNPLNPRDFRQRNR